MHSRAEEVVESLKQAEDEVDRRVRWKHSLDRSVIGISVVVGFPTAVAALFAYVLCQGVAASDSLPRLKQAEYLERLLSSVLLPVAALVLGCCFGTEKTKR